MPIAVIAYQEDVGERTLRRWKANYEAEGIAGLERKSRSDAGRRRSIAPELEIFLKKAATKRRRPTLATLHRNVCKQAAVLGLRCPSYSVVTDIVRNIFPAAKALWTENPSTYADTHELVHRRESTRPNEIGKPTICAQIRRIMTLNNVNSITAEIVQAARDCLVIGHTD